MIYVVTGQTATGKTAYAVDLAKKINGELINIDSRQVYKYLNIITGKDIEKNSQFIFQETVGDYEVGYYILDNIKIWLYDCLDPKISCNAFEFTDVVNKVMCDIKKRGKTPILVGGTYFYLKSIIYSDLTIGVKPNLALREKLNEKKVSELQDELKKINPSLFESLNNSDKNNPHRLIRKIEISMALQPSASIEKKLNNEYKIIGFSHKDKNKLREKIFKRVENRVKNGAVEEVKKLFLNGYTLSDPGLKTIGYVQIAKYLNHELSLEDAISEWANKEVQYAKRQLTFMKKDENIIWHEIV